jgi:hypothetical protein
MTDISRRKDGLGKTLVRKSERKTDVGRPRCRWDDNIKMNVEQINMRM